MVTFNRYVGSLSLGVFFLSFVGIFDRLLYPISGYVNTFFGYVIVFILATIFILASKNIKHIKLRHKRKELLFLALGQLGSAAFFLKAVQMIDFATTGLLPYSAPIWIALFYVVTKEEKLTSKIIIPLVLGLVGVVLVLGPNEILSQSKNVGGLLLALLSGISYAFSFIFARKIKDEYKTSTIVFWSHLIGAVVLLPFIFTTSFSINKITLLYFLGIGISWAMGYAFFYHSLRFIKAHLASLIATIEPIFIALWGYLFFSEPISTLTFIGGALLLTNAYLINKQIE